MTEKEPTAEERALGLSFLRGMVALAAVGSVLGVVFGTRAMLGYESILPLATAFPSGLGAIAVIGNAILVLHARGVGRGVSPNGAYLDWIWENVPKTLLVLSALATVFSAKVFEHMPDYPRGSPEARMGLGQQAELSIGVDTVFYVYGGSILVGALSALRRQ
ncbi:MAG: hypothetical protein WDM79_15595 [Terricaulis sp.]